MAWITPVQNWGDVGQTVVGSADLNRIEGNTDYLKTNLDYHVNLAGLHAKPARIVIGTSVSGWTADSCHYLCDGTADQTEINAAISALPSGGGEIILLDGTYSLTGKIQISGKSNVSIRGNGDSTVLKREWDSGSSEGVITITNSGSPKIQNLIIDGNASNYTNANNYGIHISNSSRCSIINNVITDTQIGVNINGVSYIFIGGNIYYRSRDTGIRLSSTSNVSIYNNICDSLNNGLHGIYLTSTTGAVLSGNVCINNYTAGIRLENLSRNNIIGNICNSNSGFGIALSSANHCSISGNTCEDNDSVGINISGCYYTTVGTNVANNNETGIRLASLSRNNTVTGNTCYDNDVGILLSVVDRITIVGNTCIRGMGRAGDYSSTQHTIRLTSADYTLVSSNNCMGKAVTIDGGVTNTEVNNKYE